MSFFRSNKSPKTPDQFVDDFTENLINYDNQTIYDMIARTVNFADEYISMNIKHDDRSLSPSLKDNLDRARQLLNQDTSSTSRTSNTSLSAGKKVKRKSKSKTKKMRKHKM
jgi:hypothetical protein